MSARTITTRAPVEGRQSLTRPLTKKERRQNARLVEKFEADLREAARYASAWDTSTMVGRWNGVERAIIVIRTERGRNPGLTFTGAVKACLAVGLSRRTAARAWKVEGARLSRYELIRRQARRQALTGQEGRER